VAGYVARAIVYLSSRNAGGGKVFHILSSRRADRPLFERLNEIMDTPLDLVSLDVWIQSMKRLHSEWVAVTIAPLLAHYHQRPACGADAN
jgi:hypothetical protein